MNVFSIAQSISEAGRKDLSPDMLSGFRLSGTLSQDGDGTVWNQKFFGHGFLTSLSTKLSQLLMPLKLWSSAFLLCLGILNRWVWEDTGFLVTSFQAISVDFSLLEIEVYFCNILCCL